MQPIDHSWNAVNGRIGDKNNGRIGDKNNRRFDDKNNYRKHLHIWNSKAHFYNLSRFRLGAWKLNVKSINLTHTNISIRFVITVLPVI